MILPTLRRRFIENTRPTNLTVRSLVGQQNHVLSPRHSPFTFSQTKSPYQLPILIHVIHTLSSIGSKSRVHLTLLIPALDLMKNRSSFSFHLLFHFHLLLFRGSAVLFSLQTQCTALESFSLATICEKWKAKGRLWFIFQLWFCAQWLLGSPLPPRDEEVW